LMLANSPAPSKAWHYYQPDPGPAIAAGVLGFMAGAIIASQPRAYYAPQPYYYAPPVRYSCPPVWAPDDFGRYYLQQPACW